MNSAAQQHPVESGMGSSASSASVVSLEELLKDQLRDVYSVEGQLIPALRELEGMATAESLTRLLRQQVEQTRQQKDRLETIARARGWDLDGDASKAMEGLIEGGRSHVAEVEFAPARDFLIVAHTHRIKHYEIAAYGVTVTLADRIGFEEASQLLSATLDEERHADETLSRISAEELLGDLPLR